MRRLMRYSNATWPVRKTGPPWTYAGDQRRSFNRQSISTTEETTMTEEQRESFEAVARPLIKWLNDNMHPHAAAIIKPDGAVLYSGEAVVETDDYFLND